MKNENKKYKTIHLTNEIGLNVFGGIGTVCNNLYQNRSDDELFLIFSVDGPEMDGVVYLMDEEYTKDYMIHYEAENIVIHNYLIGAYIVETCKNISDYKIYNVMHSNPVAEKLFFKSTTSDEMQMNFLILMNKVDGLIFVSEYEKQLFIDLKEQFTINTKEDVKYITIYNGADLESPEFILKDDNMRSNVIGYIGRLDTRKGLIEVMRHFNHIPDKNFYIACGGAGKFSSEMYYEFVATYIESNENGNLLPLGYVDGNRKKMFFEKIDALVVPSLYEPFGMVILEAMTMNRPVFCTKTGGMVEILGEDYPFYFNVFDEEDLSRALKKYDSMPREEIESIFKKLKSDIYHRFSAKNMVEGYKNI